MSHVREGGLLSNLYTAPNQKKWSSIMIFYNYLKELKWSYTHNHGLFLNENEIVELTRSSETEVQEKIALNCYGEAHTEGKSKKPLG